ncbi:MarR family transcriptional regulator [Gordonia sp. HY002]|uniref:MarR family winged helix-turn-helix transcriptional regulator n=1 Tax=Gordonia zhenghanii TaxID=2911516 RepID=UPI001EF0A436|nr:MarR family transcriptional regulator [Gordonia zhenghanii]MCF8569308.1 MarR family transcriptional regulator [Gordonia zhenghanii]MCF8606680.1 MarR family transcriptional regulator [Gordonia zhenghanii]
MLQQNEADGGLAPVLDGAERDLWQQFVTGGWVLYRALFNQIDSSAALSSADWRVLEVLAAAEGLRISDLAEATQIPVSTVSRQVVRFIEKGYMARLENVDYDARQKWVTITDAGREMVQPILDERDRAVRRLVIDSLSPDEFDTLCRTFGKIGERIAREGL